MEQNPAGFPPRRRRIQAVCFGVKCSETPSSTWSLPKSAGAGDALSWPWVPWVQAGQPRCFAAHTSPGKAWPLPLSPPETLFLRAWTKPAFSFFCLGIGCGRGACPTEELRCATCQRAREHALVCSVYSTNHGVKFVFSFTRDVPERVLARNSVTYVELPCKHV